MAESHHHTLLVEALADAIQREATWVNSPFLYCDIQEETGACGCPPMINGFRPDVYANDLINDFTIIGEAKTKDDIDNQHTIGQLESFFNYLKFKPLGEVWLAVPWLCAGTMMRVCRQARTLAKAQEIPYRIVEYMISSGPVYGRTWHG